MSANTTPQDNPRIDPAALNSKMYEKPLEEYWLDYENNPDYCESDEDYIGG